MPSWRPSTAPSSSTIVAGDRQRAAAAQRRGRDEARVVAVGDEADLLRLGLVAFGRPSRSACGAHLVLGQVAEREPHRAELVAGHREQEVRLVLAGIDAAPQQARTVDDLRVVAGGEHVGADRARALEQRRELDVLVAPHARVRRLAREVRLDEVVDHRGAELGREIDDVVRDAEVRAHRARVLDVARAAAAPADAAAVPRAS